MVPVLDLARRGARYADRFSADAADVVRSGQFLLGERLAGFESDLARRWPGSHAVGVSSGAAAIQLTLAALGVGAGDEVIVPAFTAVPTASAVCALGAVPVPVDVDPGTAGLRGELIAAARTDRTKAVVVVHLYGRPSPLPATDLPVVEDAAQAFGAIEPGASAAVALSFYPTKNLGGIGDGGAVVTPSAEAAGELRRRRNHGMVELYEHIEISQNFRMSELEAAWLTLTLSDLDADDARRRDIVTHYRSAAPELRWHPDHPRHVHHLAVFRHHDRAGVRARLADRGVASAVHYPRAITQQPAYAHFARTPCPEAEAWAAQCITVPCFAEMTDVEVELVANVLAGIRS